MRSRQGIGQIVPVELVGALRRACAPETCYPPQRAEWTAGNPALGHCLVTARYLQERFGGDLVMTDAVLPVMQEKTILHFFNRFAGNDVDLTRDQFPPRTHYRDYDLAKPESRTLYEECLSAPEFLARLDLFSKRVEAQLAPLSDHKKNRASLPGFF